MKGLLLILFFLAGICHHACAQHKDVDYFFVTDTVITSFGKTFSNKLKVINYTSAPLTLFKTQAPPDGALIGVPDTITLAAGGMQLYPVKYFTSAKLTYKVSFTTDAKVLLQDSAVFHVKMDDPYQVKISTLEPELYLEPQTGSISFRLRCVNDGYLPVRLRLLLNSYPQGLDFEKQTEIMELAAGSRQIITLRAKRLLKGEAPDFTVNIEAADMEGKVLSAASLKVISLSGVKRLAKGYDPYTNLLNNSVELSYVNMNRNTGFLQLRGNGRVLPSGNSRVDYNLNLNYYTRLKSMDAYDTWVSYSNKNFGITAGNIAENLDYPMYGRGVKASAFLNEKNAVDLYYVNNSYLLFSGMQPQGGHTNTYAASYRYGKAEEKNARISFIHNNETNLINGEATVLSSEQQRLTLSAGFSYENSQAGYALGGMYTIQKGRWGLNLDNYASTGYYSGMRRGVIQLEERFRYTLDSLTGAYIRYSLLKNDPRYLSAGWPAFNSNNQVAVYEIGMSRKMHAFSVTLYPYLLSQHLDDNYFTGTKLHSFSTRLALDLGYSHGWAMLALNTDYGYTKSNHPGMQNGYHSLRISANFSAPHWGISARMQNNPYYLQEELQPVTNKKYRQYSIGPNVRMKALRQRMEVSLSAYINNNNYAHGWMSSMDAQVKYSMGKTWQLSAQVFHNGYSNLKNSAGTQLRIGILKNFASANAPGLKKLELTFFGDSNSNGIRDNDEQPVEGVIAAIAGTVAVSNKKGRIVLYNLEKGEKTVQVKEGKGWNLPVPLDVSLQRNTSINVPLVKSGKLSGRLVPVAQKYITREPALEGIRVIATDALHRTFLSVTNENGEFYFSLPAGRYIIHVETAGQQFSVTDPRKEVMVNELNNSILTFQWLDERRKTEVKRF